jgi:AcrR family transcriptional regulator
MKMTTNDTKTSSAPSAPKTARGARTRAKILKAAEDAFGSLGYHQAGVSDITRLAGVAQGTFYTYFASKEDTLRELVRDMGQKVRSYLASEIKDSGNRIEAEALGLRAFLKYVAANPSLYRVLQEAQFVDESIYQEYYNAFGRGYLKMLADATQKGEIRPGNDEVRVWALMGMSNFLGMRFSIWEQDIPIDEVVETIADLLTHGLALTSRR